MHLPSILAEHRLLPDSLIRYGIRKQLATHSQWLEKNPRTTDSWIEELNSRVIAESSEQSKEQHYEVPTDYFNLALGPHLKYSCCIWDENTDSLEKAEEAALKLTCERASLQNGQSILELGCGWGSLSLWMAEHYPQSTITAMSHSKTQKAHIENQAQIRNLKNIEVITSDINDFQTEDCFDRIVSLEMFEHLRNHQKIFDHLNLWLKPDGMVFIHVFVHKKETYLFEVEHERDWMAQYFFTGGIMPSVDLLPKSARAFKEVARWPVNGKHYSKTLEAWLQKQDLNEDKIKALFKKTYGKDSALWIQRWRIFYMACSELFAYKNGTEWLVMHYRFTKK